MYCAKPIIILEKNFFGTVKSIRRSGRQVNGIITVLPNRRAIFLRRAQDCLSQFVLRQAQDDIIYCDVAQDDIIDCDVAQDNIIYCDVAQDDIIYCDMAQGDNTILSW